MTELVTSAQMRAIEAAAIASGAVTALDLMERAGAAVVAATFAQWPALAAAPGRAVVLCGPGNNGGDGFVVARLLHQAGWQIEVFLLGDPEKLPPDARANYQRWQTLGATKPFLTATNGDFRSEFPLHREPEIVIDGLFGTGLARPLDAGVTRALHDLSGLFPAEYTRWIAIDVVSGLCADSGRYLGDISEAEHPYGRPCALTVTFHAAKPGHYLGQGSAFCDRLVVADIGLSSLRQIHPPEASGGATAQTHLIEAPTAPLAKSPRAHKYGHGHALILAGGPGKGGAARLAARGALRIGAGLVTLACPQAALAENAARLEAVMLLALADGYSLRGILADKRITALALGPGLGAARARDLVPAALAARRATVLDADALTAFADEPLALFEFLHPACVLTPHLGEFARLFPDLAEKLAAPATSGPAYSKLDATRAAASRAGCVVLLKGADTVVAAPDGRAAIHAAAYDRAAPWLATAGAGDVLAGFIAGLMARGAAPMQAAETAALLHVECARAFGPGLIAEDLPEALPGVLRALGA